MAPKFIVRTEFPGCEMLVTFCGDEKICFIVAYDCAGNGRNIMDKYELD